MTDRVLYQHAADSIVTHIICLLRGNSDMHSSPSLQGQRLHLHSLERMRVSSRNCLCGPTLMCRAIFMRCFSVLGKWNLTLSPTYLAQCGENLFVSYYAAVRTQYL